MDGGQKSTRKSEPTCVTSTMRLELSSSANRRGSSSKSTIWDTLDEAKKKQETIRNRVRKYGQEDDDSDYNDSPSYDAPSHDTASCDCDTSLEVHEKNTVSTKNNMYERDDDRKLEPQPKSTEKKDENSSSPLRYSSLLPGSNFAASRSESHQSQALQINTAPGLSKLYSSNNHMQQSHTRIKYPARSENQPLLTPEEAIRLVMERHSYISDSERTDDDNPLPSRNISKGSSSTNETAMNSVNSDSGHNRTPEGKRILVLRKKYRKDTHPHTSNKNIQQNQCVKSHQIEIRNQQQGGSNSRASKSTKNEKVEAEVKYLITATKTDQSSKHLSRHREEGFVRENKNSLKLPQKKREKIIVSQSIDWRFRNQYGVVDEADDVHVDCGKGIATDMQPLSTKHCFEDTSNYRATVNEKYLQGAPSPVDNEVIIEKEIVFFDSNDDSHLSDNDDSVNVFSNTNNAFVQLSLNPSEKLECINVAVDENREIIFPEQMDGEDYHIGVAEDDWRAVSWKTAKTSRSAASKFSKSSSTSIWIKGMGEVDTDVNQDDDILFFDAIQEAGQLNGQTSTNAIDNLPTVITRQISKKDIFYEKFDSVESKEQLGWTEKITSFVGYTLSALSGSKDEYDKDSGGHDTSGATPDFETAKTPQSSISKRRSHASPAHRSKPVPSRELEIIKKCQALMKSQRSFLQIIEKENERNLLEDIRLRRKEEAARARVWREVMAYREMMEGMGKGDKLAPLNSKDAAQEYDDRLSMIKTLQDQEKKMRMHERNMKQMEMRTNDVFERDPGSCNCSCAIS